MRNDEGPMDGGFHPKETMMADTDRLTAIDYLKRKARSVRLQAGRSAPYLATQLTSLAALYEAQADQLMHRQGLAFLDKGPYLAGV